MHGLSRLDRRMSMRGAIRLGRKPKSEEGAEAGADSETQAKQQVVMKQKPQDDGESAQQQMDGILRGLVNLRECMQRAMMTGAALNVMRVDYDVVNAALAVMSNIDPESAKEFFAGSGGKEEK
jgi:hypothetical protein